MLTQFLSAGRCGLIVVLSSFLLPACTDQPAPSDIATTTGSPKSAANLNNAEPSRTGKRRSPITIQFKVSEGAVGKPLAITLIFGSRSERGELEIHYRSSAPQNLALAPYQPETVILEADTTGNYAPQTVTLMPYQNGRYYLQVSAGLQTQNGLVMRPLSIPIQVGPGGSLIPNQKASAADDTEQGITLPARMD